MTAPQFPLPPFNEDPPGATSANDKVIIRDYLNRKVLPALNQLAARVAILEQSPAPEPAPTPVPEPTPTPTPIPVPEPPTGDAIATIAPLLGPTLTTTETAALGSVFQRYDQVFMEKLPTANEWGDNYYDRGKVYYARYVRTGDPVWLEKANAITLKYRGWTESVGYNVSPHWTLVKGAEIHYRLTGDALSRQLAAGIFAQHLVGFTLPMWGPLADLENTQSADMENRIQARCLHAALSAYRLQATYVRSDGFGGEYSPATWPDRLRTMLNQILSTQNPDGSWSWIQICGGQLNFMVGLLNDVLIEYFADFEADPRIPGAIERANEYLWSTQWRPADLSFNYASVPCNPNLKGVNVGGPSGAGDLNGLLIASFGWLSKQTGDPKWRARGDQILAGLVSDQWASNYSGSKQWNQAFAESYRYLGWR